MHAINPVNMIREFFRLEAAAGILLMIAAVIALIFVNTSLSGLYDYFLHVPVVVQIGGFVIDKALLLWINDGLMAIFFLLVGLEIKREILEGQLSSRDQIALPTVAAIGGIAMPALIYFLINQSDANAVHGWAIPSATDIAFALGIMQLLGNRVPQGLKVALVTIAILDDLAAILIIALFYGHGLHPEALAIAVAMMVGLFVLNKRGVTSLTPYAILGIIMWACVLKSGVHATLAGVVLAMFIPLRAENRYGRSPARSLEHDLHPWVAYGVLPLFAFANAGVPLHGLSMDLFMQPITLGIILGLFFGKQLGVVLATLLGRAIGLCKLPEGVSWRQYYGMAVLTGIGFTMSLFIGTLAFHTNEYTNAVRLGVLTASVLSSVFGLAVLHMTCPKKPKTEEARLEHAKQA